ncbi:thioredoxin family protein [Chloroflexota bacterium]
MSIDLNRDNYESEVTKSKGVVMVDFWGPQCKPCLALMPAVDKLEKEYADQIIVAKVNAQENRMLCATLRVIGLPAYLFYKDGIEVNRLTGEQLSENDLEEAIKTAIA